MGEAIKSQHPIDPTITAGAKDFVNTQDLPITYANVNRTLGKLEHSYIGPYKII